MSLEQNFKEILENLNTEKWPERTPERAAKAYRHLTKGYHSKLDDIIKDAVYPYEGKGIITVADIDFSSLCEHHMLPFLGTCKIKYSPNHKIIGLSKFSRIVDHFSRRFQLQEKLTLEIANAIQDITKAKFVEVSMKAKHLCMVTRGVEKVNSYMETFYSTAP